MRNMLNRKGIFSRFNTGTFRGHLLHVQTLFGLVQGPVHIARNLASIATKGFVVSSKAARLWGLNAAAQIFGIFIGKEQPNRLECFSDSHRAMLANLMAQIKFCIETMLSTLLLQFLHFGPKGGHFSYQSIQSVQYTSKGQFCAAYRKIQRIILLFLG